MRTILIILGILVCVNFLVIAISKNFEKDISADLKAEISLNYPI